MSKPKLHIAGCSHEAAKFAVMNWHYSKRMPVGKLVKFGVWENDKFIGAVIFGYGNNQYQGRFVGLNSFEIVELLRVALTHHESNVSKIVSIIIKLLKKQSSKLQAIISYADPQERHHGGIYQAMNWFYIGDGGSRESYIHKRTGQIVHSRTVSPTGYKEHFGRKTKCFSVGEVEKIVTRPKYKYFYPLTKQIREKVQHLAKPYPKRETSICSDASTIQVEKGGANPTVSLH